MADFLAKPQKYTEYAQKSTVEVRVQWAQDGETASKKGGTIKG